MPPEALETQRIVPSQLISGTQPQVPFAVGTLTPGEEVAGRYRIEKAIGSGGSARVWLAYDAIERRPVALKEIAPLTEKAAEWAALQFRREFFAMRKLQHPGTVKVYDCGTLPNGNRYIAMEPVGGEDLRERALRRFLSRSETLRLLTELGQILAFVHARLFVHCDIKADNVRLLEDGSVKLMDFGLMHQLGTSTGGAMFGTPAYMAPEWQRAGTIDGRADLYSLGILGFFAITGELPFHGRTLSALFTAHRERPPPEPSVFVPVDPAIEAIVLKLLAKDPADRFQNAGELLRALASITGATLAEEPLAASASYLHVPVVVGRSLELAALEVALDETKRGQAPALFIGAPAGVGKSRLLAELELRAALSDLLVATGQCHPEGFSPLAPLRQGLRMLAARSPKSILEPHAKTLEHLLHGDEHDETHNVGAIPPKHTVFEALGTWLSDLAAEKPFVLCLEDLHWADPATVEHFNVAIRALRDSPALVVATYRPNEVPRQSVIHQTMDEGLTRLLELRPLSTSDLANLVAQALPGFAAPQPFVSELHAATAGNAFFATECLRLLIEEGALTRSAGRWLAADDLALRALPPTIEAVVRDRLQNLPEAAAIFLRKIAPAGRVLDVSLLRAVSDLPEEALFEVLDLCTERQFLLRCESRYLFTHDTVQGAVYLDTHPADRRVYHGTIAAHLEATLEGPEGARAVGYHYARSNEPRRAIAPLLRAGNYLVTRGAQLEGFLLLREAAELLEKAPDYPDQQTLLVETWGALIEVGYTADTPASFHYASKLFAHWGKTIDLAEGARLVRKAFDEAERAPSPKERQALLTELTRERKVTHAKTPAEVFLKRAEYRVPQSIALAIMRRTEEFSAVIEETLRDHPETSPYRAATLIAKGGLTAHTGHFAGIVEELGGHVERLRQFIADVPTCPARVAWGMGMGAYFLNMNLALMGSELDTRATVDGFAMADRLGSVDLRIYHLFAQVVRASFVGDASTFVPHLGEMTSWMRRLGNPRLPERNLAIYTPPYYLEREDLEGATAIVRRGEQIHRDILPGDGWLALYVKIYGACLHVLARDWDQAEPALHEAIEHALKMDFRMATYAMIHLARLEIARRRPTFAQAAAERALARAVNPDTANPWDEILARRALAAAHTDADVVAHHLRLAVALAAKTGNILQEGIAWYSLAGLGSAAGDRVGTLARLSVAEARFVAAHAEIWESRVHEAKREW
jgi:hypothetical protein